MATDPFENLREPNAPLAPRAAFAAKLRQRLAARLGVADQGRPPVPEIREYTPARYTSLHPMLSCPRASEALEWYVDVFDAVLLEPPYMMDDGRLGHAELRVGNTVFSIADEWPELDLVGPSGTNSVSLMLYVPDAIATYERAVAHGATGLGSPEPAYGALPRGTIQDPFGHRWNVGTALEPDDVPTEDIASRRLGDVGYITLHVPDGERARSFYSALFGWDIRDGSVPGGYHIESVTPPAGIAGDDSTVDPSTRLYFRVDDIETAAAKVRELGGEVLSVQDYASGGNAECRDDQGLRFDLFRPRPGY